MSRWFQIESLYKFNAKFAPAWVPRFMVFTSTRDALRVGLAALEAEAFLVWPKLEARRIFRNLRNAVIPARSPSDGSFAHEAGPDPEPEAAPEPELASEREPEPEPERGS